MEENKNVAIKAEKDHTSAVESAYDYLEHFDILETITNVGNDEVFTPRKTCDMILDSLPEEVWHNPNYKWLNPATKNGIFEREIAIRLDRGLKDIIPDEETRKKHILQNMIFAIGQTKFTANVARRTLYYCSQANRKCDGIKASDGHYVNGYAIGNGTWFDDEEGNIKTPKSEHAFEKNGKCKFCGVQSDSKYNSSDQREHYAYEFIHYGKFELERHLQDLFFKGDRTMKFDVIIGNPPYQLSTNDSGIQAAPIYQKFVLNAISLEPKFISMIIPSRWFTGGIGLDEFRTSFLNDMHVQLLHDFPKSRDCFPTVDIAGGVCFFLWDSTYNGNTKVISQTGDKTTIRVRKMNDFDIFVRDNIGVDIITKVSNKSTDFLNNFVYSISPFNLPTNTRGEEKPFSGSVKLISSKGESYIDAEEIKKGKELIAKYKVTIGQLNPDRGGVNNALDGKSNVTTKIKIYGPGEVFTATYLLLGAFDTLQEAKFFESFIKTKFVRYLIFSTLSSMHITKDNFRFVPLLKFDHAYSDTELNSYFELNGEEIDLINSLIREMI